MAIVNLEQVRVIHNEAAHQFLAYEGDQRIGLIDYDEKGDLLLFVHTEVPSEFGGQGVAAKLTREAFEMAKAAGKRVKPVCSYTRAFVHRHPEYQSFT